MLRVMLLIVGLSGALAGCGLRDPLGEVPRLSETEAAALENSVALAERQAEQSGGLRGFWALFGGGDETTPEGEQESETETPAAQEPPPEAAKSPGFFARLFGGGGAAEASEEDLLPRACNLPRAERGRRIASRAGFTLYDSFPHSTAPRPFYVTGFRDGCARQITAALVMFGEAGVYQTGQLYARRGRRSDGFDRAYEDLKSRICRVGRGQACGAQQARFDRAVAMLTAYPRFESSPGGTNILLHDRKVVALSD